MTEEFLDDIEEAVGSEVTVLLKNGLVVEGILQGSDQHLNLVVEEDNSTTIIRGDNIVSVR